MWELIGYSVLSLTVLCLTLLWLRCYSADVQAASELVDKFYDSAQKLIKDENTPESVVKFIEYYADQVGKPSLARGFAIHLMRGKLGLKGEGIRSRFSADIESLNSASMAHFVSMVATGMVSSAASDPFFSRVYLNVVRMFLSKSGVPGDELSPERARSMAEDVAFGQPAVFA